MVEAKDITRVDVQSWIDEWKEGGHGELPDYIRTKVKLALGNNDPIVMRAENEDVYPVHVADKIINDLESYDLAAGS